jgi:hypothetical protein
MLSFQSNTKNYKHVGRKVHVFSIGRERANQNFVSPVKVCPKCREIYRNHEMVSHLVCYRFVAFGLWCAASPHLAVRHRIGRIEIGLKMLITIRGSWTLLPETL